MYNIHGHGRKQQVSENFNHKCVRTGCDKNVAVCRTGVGSYFLVAGQKQTLQDMTGRTNFPTEIPFILLYMMLIILGNLLNSNEINS